jgi:hypothetical protein
MGSGEGGGGFGRGMGWDGKIVRVRVRKQELLRRVGVVNGGREGIVVIVVIITVVLVGVVATGGCGWGRIVVVAVGVRSVRVMIEVLENGVFNLISVPVSERYSGRHVLLTAHLGHSFDGVGRHRELCPAMTDNASTGGEAQKIMASLCVAGGTEADGTEGAMTKVICVFFVGLDVGTERETNMFVVGQIASGEEETGGMIGGDAIVVR